MKIFLKGSRAGGGAGLLAAFLLGVWVFGTHQAVRGASSSVDLEARVAELEEALAAEVRENKEARKQVEEILAYLEKQAAGAKKLSTTLDKAEELGFVSGINHPSRQALLDGWRDVLAETQKNLPKATAKKQPTGEEPRLRRTRRGG